MAWMMKPYVTRQQLAQYITQITSQIKMENKSAELAKKVEDLEKKIGAVQIPPPVDLEPINNSVAAVDSKIFELEKKFGAIQIPPPVDLEPINNSIAAVDSKIFELEKKIGAIQIPPPPNLEPFKNAIINIGNRVIALEKKVGALPPPVDLEPINNSIAVLANRIDALEKNFGAIQIPPPVDLNPLVEMINKLNAEMSSLRQSNEKLSARVEELEKNNAELSARPAESEKNIPTTPPEAEPKPEPEPKPEVEPPEKFFYLPEQAGAFIPNERQKISALVKQAADVKDLKKFLLANPSAAPANFQRLLDSHVKDVQKFANKLNLKDLDDEELSETVTAKYFKLFQRIIFDNLLIVIKDRLNPSDEFYPAFLSKLNDYLSRCGIYTVNARSGQKVSNEDYANMSPQILNTDDENLIGTVKEISRLPYRINYISEATGETNFFQYNGVMTLYKAVQ